MALTQVKELLNAVPAYLTLIPVLTIHNAFHALHLRFGLVFVPATTKHLHSIMEYATVQVELIIILLTVNFVKQVLIQRYQQM